MTGYRQKAGRPVGRWRLASPLVIDGSEEASRGSAASSRVRLVFGYCETETATDVEFDSLRPSSVQTAPVALQSVVAGSVMVIVPLPRGSTVMVQV